MTGRHASDSSAGFYKDLMMMIVGILLVGAAVFLVLYLIADNDGGGAGSTTSSAAGVTTTTVPSGSSSTSAGGDTTSTTGSTAPSTSSTIPVRPPSEVTVVVLNSIGVDGAAGRLTQVLADAGYQTLQADDYEPEQDPSRIWYRDGFSAEANVLLELIPGAVVEPIPDDDTLPAADVVLVLGTGYEE